MGGHVNMMDDVLISNLPKSLLRSSLRTLISQGATTQQPFVEHIRQRLLEAPPEFLSPERLFPKENELSSECKHYLEIARCVFSCKLAQESLTYLIHFVDSITQGEAKWSKDSDLESMLETFGGDVVQAVQALKESKTEPTDQLKDQLSQLMFSFQKLQGYCKAANLVYPFARADRQVQDVFMFLFSEPSPTSGIEDMSPLKISIKPSGSSSIQMFKLGPHQFPRLFNGFWQLSSPAWGSGTFDSQEKALIRLAESGLVAADMADHYGDAELIYGDFRARLAPETRDEIKAATKWCIFGPVPCPISYEWAHAAVKERSRRLRGRVELLQLHWHNYEAKEYLNVLEELVKISKMCPELVSSIGLCNFDSEHLEEACKYLLKRTGSVGLVSNQVQFSLFDTRPLQKMCAVCSKYGLKLLTYGSFCGGFISEKWLGQDLPEVYSESTKLTPSQRKYLDIIHTWGNWGEFQNLLQTLETISKHHKVSLTNVAIRWILQQPAVGAVIVGTRLGVTAHGDENLEVFSFELSDNEIEIINQVALGEGGAKSVAMFEKLGDCGNEYRAMH